MQAITTIGLDIAKSVFQVHGIDAEGKVVIRRQLKRALMSWRSSRSWRLASLVLRPALHHIIGRASSRGSGTRCA
jgi:transposase